MRMGYLVQDLQSLPGEIQGNVPAQTPGLD